MEESHPTLGFSGMSTDVCGFYAMDCLGLSVGHALFFVLSLNIIKIGLGYAEICAIYE